MSDTLPGSWDLTDIPTAAPASEGVVRAVALEYERGRDEAPRVTASGRGAIAEQILAIAFAEGIKVRKDADLVELLEAVEVDSPIPLEAFATVAEILSYVYGVNAALAKRRAATQRKDVP